MTKHMSFAVLASALLASCAAPAPMPATEIATVAPTTAPPTTAPTATATSTPAPQQYYTENFDQESKTWLVAYLPHDEMLSEAPIDKVSVLNQDGFLKFDIEDNGVGAFAAYDPFEYTDVRLDARIMNRSKDANFAGLMCRYSPDHGWYEFAIAGHGRYLFFSIEQAKDGKLRFGRVLNGFSDSMKPDANELGMVCQGSSISLYINGTLARVIHDSNLTSGKVGVQALLVQPPPLKLDFDWVKISQP